MTKNRMYQGGSLGSYIVVGALLVLLLVGGLYTVGRIDNESGQIATDTSDNTEDNGTTPDSSSTDTTNSDTDKNTDNTKNDTPVSSDDSNTTTDDSNTTTGSSNDTEELPATGASETFAAAAILSLVTYAGALYIGSRRA
ncbi:MAG TPA: hypothetical protein PLU21_03225 [Candidatus Saccharibacteria bacterium]|nr:hypothetical protein [Candidatus Saccharibacteria bacterium]